MNKLLIVDDNQDVRKQLKWGLARGPYELHFAQDAEEALATFRKIKPGVVTLDLGLPPEESGVEEGLRCLSKMLETHNVKVIVITGNEGRDAALRAVQSGAYDYYKKPIDLKELKVIIDRAFYLLGIEREFREFRSDVGSNSGIVGQCPGMQKLFVQIDKVAVSELPILITGESGTGKELVAQAIHAKSTRRDNPLVSINCGAIPENLLESELFGHEKGAFTGALRTVKGKVECADTGTLFLDEIGEFPLQLQVKLLRFLQEMAIQRVGGRVDINVDVRIIAATNIDVHEAMREGTFREDLYYRIGVVNIVMPPLRDRGEDILLLANYFLKKNDPGAGFPALMFSESAIDCIKNYEWPGNIRELENRIKGAVIMASSAELQPGDLGFKATGTIMPKVPAGDMSLKEARSRLDREIVGAALDRCAGNIVKAAASIGVSRPTFYDLLKKHSLKET